MAESQEGGRGSLLTRLQASGLIRANDKIVYRGSEGQEYEGVIVLGDDNAVYVKHGGESLKNEAAFVRKATGDATIPKNFKNTLTIGGRAFRDIQDEYKKLNPRPERPERAERPAAAAGAAAGGAARASGARRTRRPNVRLGQLVSSGKLALGSEAWFDSKAGRITGQVAEKERRYGFTFADQFYPTPAAFIRAAEESRGVAEADRIQGKWDQTLHVGDISVREAREKYLAERPPPEPRAPAASSSSSAAPAADSPASKQLAQVREQIKKLREKEAELLAQLGEPARRGRGGRPRARGRRSKPADAAVAAQ